MPGLLAFLPHVWTCRSPSLVDAPGEMEGICMVTAFYTLSFQVLPHHILFKKNLHHSVTSHFKTTKLTGLSVHFPPCLCPPKYTMKKQSRKCLPCRLHPARPCPVSYSEAHNTPQHLAALHPVGLEPT